MLLYNGKQRHMQKKQLSWYFSYVIAIVTWQAMISKTILCVWCFVDDGTHTQKDDQINSKAFSVR